MCVSVRSGRIFQGLVQTRDYLLLRFARELVSGRLKRLGGKLPARPVQELQLGGVAPAPNAIQQMKPNGQAARPGKLRIH